MNWNRLLISLICLLALAACNKDELATDPYADVPATGTRLEKSLDSVFLYAYETYLWNDALPSYSTFTPRGFNSVGSSELSVLNSELYALSQVAINPLTGIPYESPLQVGYSKYSSLQHNASASSTAPLAALSIEGTGNDLGLVLASSGAKVFIKQVYPGSPAHKAGLARGLEVVTINGQVAAASAVLDRASLNLTVKQGDGSEKACSLASADYSSSLIYKQAVLHTKAGKIGYIALSQFTPLAQAQADLDVVFEGFAKANVKTLVIDLRYNGGGYVETAEYLANLIAPSSINGKVMYAEHFNSQMQQGRATMLKNQTYYDANGEFVDINGRRATLHDVDFSIAGNTARFEKKGTLETVQQVYFIVSGSTASASELLINSLRPHLEVHLVGSTTYGKPVGFFGIKIDQYTLYLSNFQIRNANGEGDYFAGIEADIAASDDVTHDWADPQEECLASVLAALGAATKSQIKQLNIRQQRHIGILTLKAKDDGAGATDFVGMVENRLKLIGQ